MTFSLKTDPIDLFSEWYELVLNSSCKEPFAMTLATCSENALPFARVVLLKEYSKEGFVFFTNVNSKKGQELISNPRAALVFYWMEFSRQVRIEGNVKLIDKNKTDEYYFSRTRDSQISAWCSKQSSVLKNWHDFEQDIELKNSEFRDQQIPRPDFWVGFCVVPKTIEFWQEGEHRRHTRFKYTSITENTWKIEQLYP